MVVEPDSVRPHCGSWPNPGGASIPALAQPSMGLDVLKKPDHSVERDSPDHWDARPQLWEGPILCRSSSVNYRTSGRTIHPVALRPKPRDRPIRAPIRRSEASGTATGEETRRAPRPSVGVCGFSIPDCSDAGSAANPPCRVLVTAILATPRLATSWGVVVPASRGFIGNGSTSVGRPRVGRQVSCTGNG